MDNQYNDNYKKKKEREIPKVMPNNIEAEQSLLGAILIDNSVGLETLSELAASDFYYTAHQDIFECMIALQRVGKPIDVITMANLLTNEDKLDSIGGMSYLSELTNVLPSAANYKFYFDIVKHNGMLRKIIGTSNEIIRNTYFAEDADLALAFAEKKIFEISDDIENKDLAHVNDTVNSVLKMYEEILTNPDKPRGQMSHFKNLDKMINGYKGGQMIVLAARPGCGKTSFAMNVVCNIAKNEPEKVVAVFNLEMSTAELTQRILLTTASVPQQSVQAGATAEEFKKLWAAKKVLEQSNMYIDDTANTTPEQIMSKCRRLKQVKKRLDFVVIDYLQLLRSHTSRSSIQQEVTEISRAIKIMAKELNVPVMALSQTSRDLEKREDGEPKLSDLRESGAIEQDADQVYFLVKDKGQEGNEFEVIDLHIIKHRSGECGKLSFKWEGSMVKFTPVTVEEAKHFKQNAAIDTVSQAAGYTNRNNDDSAKKAPQEISESIAPPVVSGAVVYANDINTAVAEYTSDDVERINVEDMVAPPVQEKNWDDEFAQTVAVDVSKLAMSRDDN